MSENDKPNTNYKCSICDAPATVENNQVIRSCEHMNAAVIANLYATAYGESHAAS